MGGARNHTADPTDESLGTGRHNQQDSPRLVTTYYLTLNPDLQSVPQTQALHLSLPSIPNPNGHAARTKGRLHGGRKARLAEYDIHIIILLYEPMMTHVDFNTSPLLWFCGVFTRYDRHVARPKSWGTCRISPSPLQCTFRSKRQIRHGLQRTTYLVPCTQGCLCLHLQIILRHLTSHIAARPAPIHTLSMRCGRESPHAREACAFLALSLHRCSSAAPLKSHEN